MAIDIAKKSHYAVIQFPTGKRLAMKFTNTLAGYQLLLKRCKADQYTVHIGFEPTADYHRTIAFWLAATSAIRTPGNSFRQKYQRHIKRDPDNKDLCRKGRTAVDAKMARIAHTLVSLGVLIGHELYRLPSN